MGVKSKKPMGESQVPKPHQKTGVRITVGNSLEVATQLEPKCLGGTF